MKMNIEKGQLRGLCTTCNLAGQCMHLARAESPVWRCEEFDDHGVEAVSPRERLEVSDSLRSELRVSEPAVGLCTTCDHAAGCSFPRAGDGIWHCEEYA